MDTQALRWHILGNIFCSGLFSEYLWDTRAHTHTKMAHASRAFAPRRQLPFHFLSLSFPFPFPFHVLSIFLSFPCPFPFPCLFKYLYTDLQMQTPCFRRHYSGHGNSTMLHDCMSLQKLYSKERGKEHLREKKGKKGNRRDKKGKGVQQDVARHGIPYVYVYSIYI